MLSRQFTPYVGGVIISATNIDLGGGTAAHEPVEMVCPARDCQTQAKSCWMQTRRADSARCELTKARNLEQWR